MRDAQRLRCNRPCSCTVSYDGCWDSCKNLAEPNTLVRREFAISLTSGSPHIPQRSIFGLRSRRRRLRHQPSLWALLSECSAQWKGQGSLFRRMLLKPCLPQDRLPQPIILPQTRVNSILEFQVCHSKPLWFMVNSLLPMTVISIPPLPEPTDFLGQRERSEKEAAFFLSERARYLY